MTIGKSINRVDAVAKVTGRARYTDDFYRPDMLVAKYFRSTIAHGKVVSIDVAKAAALPGVEGSSPTRMFPRSNMHRPAIPMHWIVPGLTWLIF